MSANQTNAASFNPNELDLPLVATYARRVGVPIVRVWENVLDWEHLPWLHHTSFDYVELDAGGDWGWRTWSDPKHQSHVELTRANEHSYVARSYQADNQVSEIWTYLTDQGDETGVEVQFYIANVADDARDAVGAAMTRLYTRLWDEDEAMMKERHQRLSEKRSHEQEVVLGDEASLHRAVERGEKVVFQLKRREFQLAKTEGGFIAHSTICPHLLGPLETREETGELFCPWHGYRFDRETGECLFPESASCKLSPAPDIRQENGTLIASTREHP